MGGKIFGISPSFFHTEPAPLHFPQILSHRGEKKKKKGQDYLSLFDFQIPVLLPPLARPPIFPSSH